MWTFCGREKSTDSTAVGFAGQCLLWRLLLRLVVVVLLLLPQTYFLTYLLTPWSRVLLEKLTGSAASPEIPCIFGTRMFITVLTSARQLHPVPTTPSHFLKIHLNIILPSSFWVSPMVSFPQVSPPEPCTPLSPAPYAPHAPPISFLSILPPAQYSVRSTDHWALHYVIFSIPLLPRP